MANVPHMPNVNSQIQQIKKKKKIISICSHLFLLLSNLLFSRLPGASIWIPTSDTPPADPKCKYDAKTIFLLLCKKQGDKLYSKHGDLFSFSFPPSMPTLFLPRILYHPCSRIWPHKQARFPKILFSFFVGMLLTTFCHGCKHVENDLNIKCEEH